MFLNDRIQRHPILKSCPFDLQREVSERVPTLISKSVLVSREFRTTPLLGQVVLSLPPTILSQECSEPDYRNQRVTDIGPPMDPRNCDTRRGISSSVIPWIEVVLTRPFFRSLPFILSSVRKTMDEKCSLSNNKNHIRQVNFVQ